MSKVPFPALNDQELLCAFVRQMPAAMAVFDSELRYLCASDRWCAQFGVELDQIIGRTSWDVFPEYPEHWIQWQRRALAGETVYSDEEHVSWRGRWVWVKWEIRPWGLEGSPPAGIVVLAENITVRKAAEIALARSEREYRDLVDNSPDGIARLSPDGRYLRVNRQMAIWSNCKPEDYAGKLAGSVSAGSSDIWVERIQRIARSGQPESVEHSFPSGLHLSMRFIPEFHADGSVESVLLIATDVTEQRSAEALAGERASIIQALFDTAAQGILATGEDGRIQLINRSAEQMFGYERGELLQQSHEVLLPDALRELHRGHYRDFCEERRSRPMGLGLELRGRRKDGTLFPVDVSLSFVESTSGLVSVAFVTDISERRQQQAELQKLKADLYEAEEAAARDLARELHDDITQRLAFLSIEIGKAAAESDPGSAVLPKFRAFQSRIHQISEGVRQISHRMHPSIIEDLGLTAALQSLTEDLERASGIPVEFETRGVPERLEPGLASCLYRVCQECLRNTVTHARAQQVAVRLSCQESILELQVSDNGVGFDPEAPAKGGLGRFSMMERVNAVGGTLSVDSQPNRGTRVTVRVPLPEH